MDLVFVKFLPPSGRDQRLAGGSGLEEPARGARRAYAIGKRVGPAVRRNRIRRRLDAQLTELDRRSALPPGDYVISARAAAADVSVERLRSQLALAVDRVTVDAR